MRALMILTIACAMSACSIRTARFLSGDAGAATDAGRDMAAVDVARDLASEVAVDMAPDMALAARPDARPDTARDVVTEAAVDQTASEAAADTAGDTADDATDGASDASDDSSMPPVAVCGNGIKEGNEECDEGTDDTPTCNGSNAGSLGCRTPRCGDEHTNLMAGEECDTGIPDNTSTCIGYASDPNYACKLSACGDGYVNLAVPDICDDGNTSACGTCSADCTTRQPGGDCPGGTGCTSGADCGSNDCQFLSAIGANVCLQAP